MPRQDEIDRMILMFYLSRNSSGYTNWKRPIDWLDNLPMEGLNELSELFDSLRAEVEAEKKQRIEDGMPRYSRRWYEDQAEEARRGADHLASIGIPPDGGE